MRENKYRKREGWRERGWEGGWRENEGKREGGREGGREKKVIHVYTCTRVSRGFSKDQLKGKQHSPTF